MNITGPEPVVRGVLAWLGDKVPLAIAEVNTDATDGILLPDVQQFLPYAPTPVGLEMGLPIVGIKWHPLKFEDDTGWGATGVQQFSVIVYDTDYDHATLATRLMRWVTVLMKALCPPNRQITDEAWGTSFISADPGPTLTRGEDAREYMSLVAVTVELRFTQES